MSRGQWRARLVAVCLVLTALAFSQSPGLIAADTKLDLTQDPISFLARSLHLWDGQAFFGQLQNQAYGYLFPMGPFFAVGRLVHLDPWVVQRLWWSLLLCTAFLGAVRLSRLVGVANPWARLAVGLSYVVAPRLMSTLGPISAEALPFALAPWVVVPLAAWRSGRPVVRAAALSGVAVLLMGGVNATASAGAAVLGLIWILTEVERGYRVRLALAWAGCVALATAWYVGPLLILGRWSPPFLDWIESASVTTSITDGGAVLRGTTDWVAYLADASGPQWPAAWQLINERWMIMGTVALAVVGAYGLVRSSGRCTRFALVSICAGALVMVAPHVAQTTWATGPFAEELRVLLDGVLSPLRNVHKVDALVRLPLALGVGLTMEGLLSAAARRRSAQPGSGRARRSIALVACVGVVCAVLASGGPLLAGSLTENRTFASVPDYWQETADWLADNGGDGRALLVPGASFGLYLWGSPRDEPLQALSRSDWGVRDAVPLSSAGNIRALDAVEDLLARGRSSADLAPYLARMGITHLVVRNDLDESRVDAPPPSVVHQVLDASGGLRRVAYFGPFLRGGSSADLAVDGGIDGSYPAVEVYEIDPAATYGRAVIRDASAPLVLHGEAEGLLGVSGLPGLSGRSVVRSGDGPELGGEVLLTDSGRRTEVDFGRVHDNRSSLLTPGSSWTRDRRVHDYIVVPGLEAATVALPPGWQVVASTSRGDAASVRLDVSAGPWNAVDGETATAWFPRTFAGAGQWWEATSTELWGADRRIGLRIASDPPGTAGSATLEFETDRGRSEVTVDLPADRVAIPSELLPTTRLRVSFPLTEPSTVLLGISEVESGRTPLERTSTLPAVGERVGALALRTRDSSVSACVPRQPTNCWPPRIRAAEESSIDRLVTSTGLGGALTVETRARPGLALDRLLLPPGDGAIAAASSVRLEDPNVRPQAAIDRDPWTAWQASPLDKRPTLRVTLPRKSRVSWVRVLESAGLAASRPLGVDVVVGGRTFASISDSDGYLRFPPTVTSSIILRITSTVPMLAYDTALQKRTVLPVGISDLVLGEADRQRVGVDEQAVVTIPCGFGPSVEVSGSATVLTEVRTTVAALLQSRPVAATSCGQAALPAGAHRIVVRATGELDVAGLLWSGLDGGGARPAQPTITSWDPTRRVLEIPAAPTRRTVETGESFNAGWTATLDGQQLKPVRVDGWRQGFLLPAGAGGEAELAFLPDRLYRALLVVGAAMVLVLVCLASWRPRTRANAAAPAEPRPRSARGPVVTWTLRLGAVAVAGLAAGPAGAAGAAVAVALGRTDGGRRIAAIVFVLIGAAPALLVPWPDSSSIPPPGSTLVALAAAAGLGGLIGVLAAAATSATTVRTGARTVVPAAPPAST